MNLEEQFTAKLAELVDTARHQKGIISGEQFEEAFPSLEEDKKALVVDYLKSHGIGIGAPPKPEEYLSEEEHDYLKDYIKSLEELPRVSDAEKEGITISAMAGDISSQKRLIEIYLPLVPDIARMYAEQGVYLEDLIGEGNIALTSGVTMLKAIESASEAESFLSKLIMDAMEEAVSDALDEDARGQRAIKQVQEVADKAAELAEELRRKVTVEELSKESGISSEKIIEAMEMTGFKIEDIEMD